MVTQVNLMMPWARGMAGAWPQRQQGGPAARAGLLGSRVGWDARNGNGNGNGGFDGVALKLVKEDSDAEFSVTIK